MFWPLRHETYLHIQTSASTAGKRKKPLTGRGFRALSCITDGYGGFEIKAAVSFCFDDPCTVFWHGGFRREPPCNENYFDKFRQGLACQKSRPPAAGTSGCAYVLYYVGKEHIAFCFAQRVFDLPGEFCYFLRPAIRRKKKFQKKGGV